MVDPQDAELHYKLVVKALGEGRLIPFLGAGVNMCGRPEGELWEAGKSSFLPSGSELASYLATDFFFDEEADDLLRVSQYVSVEVGDDWLFDKLHDVFKGAHQPGPVQRLLACLPNALFRAKGAEPSYQLILTTNYDNALESAFEACGEPYHLVWYLSQGEHRGKFMHRLPGGETRLVGSPNDYYDVSTDDATVIVKIHGAVDPASAKSDGDSYVITEDHYIDYLSHATDVATLLPVRIAEKLLDSHFLFLGYSLRDWNLRVILNRIWHGAKLGKQSWAIQKEPTRLDRKFWERRGVEILPLELEPYVDELTARVGGPAAAVTP
jgi:hypothetical protein